MDLTTLDPVERVLAEHAVLAAREVRKAMDAAPHGRGLEYTERAVLTQGRRQMTLLMEEMLRAKAASEQKGGARVRAGSGRGTAPRPG